MKGDPSADEQDALSENRKCHRLDICRIAWISLAQKCLLSGQGGLLDETSRCRLQKRSCVAGVRSACCIFISSNALMKCRKTSTITHTEEQVYADVRGFLTPGCLLCILIADLIILWTSGPKVV
ncbi:hypothetical protein FQA47_017372 [Oryzias melastigma]|uniref:Uncharacterized protein n=1 Tax=Oryzias melastigma TaxID=30732 RepID=A0A834F309_ORYME|nr:hypothetical protein FQA47_017372 [Oryzias melastigma]